jgi:hypothetical protein
MVAMEDVATLEQENVTHRRPGMAAGVGGSPQPQKESGAGEARLRRAHGASSIKGRA